jgi:hypothetical protein
MLFTLGSYKNVIHHHIAGEIIPEKAKYFYKVIVEKKKILNQAMDG